MWEGLALIIFPWCVKLYRVKAKGALVYCIQRSCEVSKTSSHSNAKTCRLLCTKQLFNFNLFTLLQALTNTQRSLTTFTHIVHLICQVDTDATVLSSKKTLQLRNMFSNVSSTSYVRLGKYISNKVSYFILPCFSTGPGDWMFLPTQEISEKSVPHFIWSLWSYLNEYKHLKNIY